jgi:DNA-binding IclR family transcriptional regulator
MGRVILAFKSPAYVREHFSGAALPTFSDRTPATIDELEALLAEDRARGYVISHSNFEAGIASVAAPVFDASGDVIAAINASSPENVIDPEQFDRDVCAAVRASARKISLLAGYRETVNA